MGTQSFDAEAAALARSIRELSVADLAAPTRCGSWDVLTTVAHVIRGLERADRMAKNPVDVLADPNQLIYYQSTRRSAPGRDDVRQSAAGVSAARFSDGGSLAEAIAHVTGSISESCARIGLDSVVETHWGPVMSLGDYLRTRVVEMLAHGLDVSDALGMPAWASRAAQADVARLIRELVGDEIPRSVGWSDLELIRIGTGRQELTAGERDDLGPLAVRFPAIQ